MLELLIAMLVLNIGIFALVGAFNAGTVAVSRAGSISSATTIADRQMEVYRSLQNCAIWLDQWLMPAAGTPYALDAYDYNDHTRPLNPSPTIPYWNTASAADTQYWVTDGMDGKAATPLDQTDLISCAYTTQTATGKMTLPLAHQATPALDLTYIDGLGMVTPLTSPEPLPSSVKPEQIILGPGGTKYTVDTYIVLVQPCSDPAHHQPCPTANTGEWAKQVTVVVYDPHNSARVLAREVSTFDPTAGR